MLKTNVNRKEMNALVRDFGDRLLKGGMGLFYFAGHGMQVGGKNYLIPVGAEIQREDEVPDESMPADLVLRKMETANNGLNLVIMDACRNNPFASSFRSGATGLGRMDAPSGTLMVYATRPGSVAADGDGENGVFTRNFLAKMKQPGLDLANLVGEVSDAVENETRKAQQPWIEGNLKGSRFYFYGPVTVQQAPAANHAADAEKEAWGLIKESSDPADLKDFLEKFPNGQYANTARIKLRQLEKKQTASRPAVVTPVVSSASGFTDPTTGMEFVQVPQGFSIGKYEVTQGQWKKVMGSNPSSFSSCGDNCPVEQVSWNEVQEFVKKLNQQSGKSYRLPTEAEWEYACRAGGNHEYCGSNDINAVAWYGSNSGKGTHPVGQKQQNAWGIHDMSGNVWEWGQGSEGSYRVIRGGGWNSIPAIVRASFSPSNSSNLRGGYSVGFRLLAPVQ